MFGGLLALVALVLGFVGIRALFANPIVTVQLPPTSITEGNVGSTTVNFSVNLSQALGSGQEIVIGVATEPGPSNQATAGASCSLGVDYVSASTTLTFGTGVTTQNFPVTICGDTVDELNESFIVRATIQSETGVPTVQPPVGSSTATVAIIIDDDNPTVQTISAPSATEGAPLNFVVTLTAPGIENVVIGYFISGGTAALGTDFTGSSPGTLVIPAGSNTGTISFSTVNDGVNEPNETVDLQLDPSTSFSVNTPFLQSTATGTIIDADDPPTLTTNASLTVTEGGSGTIGAGQLAASDPDTLPGSLVFTLGTAPANGTLFLSGNPLTSGGTFTQANINANNLTYTHNGSETTSDSFTFTLTDGTTTLPAATFTITVTPVNDSPVVNLNDEAAGVDYVAAYTENAPATVIVDPNAAVTDPENDNITTLTATMNACTPAETLSATAGVGVSVAYNAATCTLTLTGPASPAAMSAVLQTLSYASTDDNPPSSRTITVTAADAGTPSQTSAAATITLTITPVDDAPTLTNNGLIVGEGQSAAISAAALQASDPDTAPEDLLFTLTSLPTRGTLRLGGVVMAGGSFTQADINAGRLVYTHDGSETTSDSFTFTLTDGTTTLPTATFNITITPENDNPVVTTSAGATFYVQGQPPVVIDPAVTVSDADSPNFGGGSLSVALTGGAPQDQLGVLNQGDGPGQIGSSGGIVRYGGVAIGSLSVSSGGPLVVLFNANATPEAVQALARAVTFANTATVTTSGPRTATFIVSDGAGGNSAPVTKVIDINLLPVAVNDTAQVIMNTSIRLNLRANDSDPDGDPLTITAVSTPGNGTATIIESGQAVRYTPNPGYRGADSFTYTVSDGRGGTATATVNLNVDRARIFMPLVNDRPVEPDLVVRFELDPNQPRAFSPATVRVTVTNRGRGPASNFWVDFYINPRQAPEVNEPWNELCRDRNCRGIAWFYEGTLRPGESVTFTSTPQSASNPTGYQPRYTIWDGFFENGSYSLYAYVDSWNRDGSGAARNPRGAVAEENEDNNLAERQITVEVSP